MSKQKLTVEIEVPEGYELTGEVRPPKVNEFFLDSDWKSLGMAYISFSQSSFPILRKVENWKPLSFEKALAIGKIGLKHRFRIPSRFDRTQKVVIADFIDFIDLRPNTTSVIRLADSGWLSLSDIEYLEEAE